MNRDRAVVITSGGLDSTILAHLIAQDYHEVHLLSFDYGQRHKKELTFASKTADRLDCDWTKVNLRGVTELLTGSSLTDSSVTVPDGHYAEDTMKTTVVPNRNMMMLSVAIACAVAENAKVVVAGMHAGDHFIYPDCRPEFAKLLNDAAQSGNEGFAALGFHLEFPFIHQGKDEIVKVGDRLGVPFAETWSCYKGGRKHCGTCGTCVERQEAFYLAGVEDPTEYVNSEFWKAESHEYPRIDWKWIDQNQGQMLTATVVNEYEDYPATFNTTTISLESKKRWWRR